MGTQYGGNKNISEINKSKTFLKFPCHKFTIMF